MDYLTPLTTKYAALCLLLTLPLGNVVIADDSGSAVRFSKNVTFIEKNREMVSISTPEIIQGFMETANKPIGEKFYFVLPKTDKTKLCVSLTTATGSISARAEVSLDGISEGAYWAPLDISEENHQKLAALPTEIVAFQTKLADSCLPGEEASYIAASWYELLESSSQTIFLNSNRTDARIALKKPDGTGFRVVPCQRISSNKNLVTYDTKCTISLSELQHAQEIYIELLYLGKRQYLGSIGFE